MQSLARTSLRVFSLFLWLLLNGCVTRETRIEGSSDAQSAVGLLSWRANGRFGVISNTQSGSGSFNWQQREAQSTVQLRGPVGIGSLVLNLDGERLQLTAGDGTQYTAADALAELEVRLGVNLPVDKLRYWLLGLPAPGSFQWLDTPIKTLQQGGWHIEYSEMLSGGALQLPARLTATQGEVRIKIVIQQWQL